MAKQKKTDRPKKVNIYFDRLSIQVGFMDYTLAGYLFKMIVFYSMGDINQVEVIQQELKQQHPDQYNLVMMAYTENKVAIDEDLKAYADVCETRRQLALVREANKREQRATTNHNEPQPTTTNHNCAQVTTKGTNTNTNTNTNTKSSNDDGEKEKKEKSSTIASIEGDVIKEYQEELLKAIIWKESMCMNYRKDGLYLDDSIREFCSHLRCMAKTPIDLTDCKQYFNNWLRLKIKDEQKEVKKPKDKPEKYVVEDVDPEVHAIKKFNDTRQRILGMMNGECNKFVANSLVGMFKNGDIAKYGLTEEYKRWQENNQ